MEFTLTEWFEAPPDVVYRAWLDTRAHTQMTGSPAHTSDAVGAAFDAWDGYITGRTVALEPNRRIVQQWRTGEFDDAWEDSLLEIDLLPENDGTRFVLRHSNLPEGQAGEQYRGGWVDWYFAPMHAYFQGARA